MKTIFIVACHDAIPYAFTTRKLAQDYVDATFTLDEQNYVQILELSVDPKDYPVYIKCTS